MVETVLLRTGNEYVKVTTLAGAKKGYRSVMWMSDEGVRVARKVLRRAGEAIEYRRAVVARYRALRAKMVTNGGPVSLSPSVRVGQAIGGPLPPPAPGDPVRVGEPGPEILIDAHGDRELVIDAEYQSDKKTEESAQ